jgi:hypothetical protein
MPDIACECGIVHRAVDVFPLRCRCGATHVGDANDSRPKLRHITRSEKRVSRTCDYRGEVVGVSDCECVNKPAVYSCGVHGLCTINTKTAASLAILNDGTRATVSHACNSCNDWKVGELPPIQYPPIATRNLIYHIYPHGSWLDAVRETAVHIDVFNGRRLVAIACDLGMNIEEVRKIVTTLLKPTQLFVMPNDRDLRETVTFEPLLRSVLNDSQAEATFYAHSKANTTDGNVDAATKWRQVMTANLLGRWQDAMRHLQSHVFVGTHKLIWPANIPSPFPTRLVPNHLWMHAGTFWWFRHDEVSRRYRTDMIARDRYAVEAFPGQLIPHEMAYSMWQPWDEHESAWPQRFPYDPGLYDTDHSR